MGELAYDFAGSNCFYGTPANPAAPGRVPGGSSAGSAVRRAPGRCKGPEQGAAARASANQLSHPVCRYRHWSVPAPWPSPWVATLRGRCACPPPSAASSRAAPPTAASAWRAWVRWRPLLTRVGTLGAVRAACRHPPLRRVAASRSRSSSATLPPASPHPCCFSRLVCAGRIPAERCGRDAAGRQHRSAGAAVQLAAAGARGAAGCWRAVRALSLGLPQTTALPHSASPVCRLSRPLQDLLALCDADVSQHFSAALLEAHGAALAAAASGGGCPCPVQLGDASTGEVATWADAFGVLHVRGGRCGVQWCRWGQHSRTACMAQQTHCSAPPRPCSPRRARRCGRRWAPGSTGPSRQ